MKTKFLTLVVFIATTQLVNAQRHYSKPVEQAENRSTHYNKGYSNPRHSSRTTVIIAPAPVVRPPVPVIVINHHINRTYAEPCRAYNNIVSENEFYEITRHLNNIHFDDDRVEYIKDKIDYNFFTSNQVSKLIEYLSFEDNRLSVAKYAYSKTIDPQNYELVYDELSFNSSKRNLDDFIYNRSVCRR